MHGEVPDPVAIARLAPVGGEGLGQPPRDTGQGGWRELPRLPDQERLQLVELLVTDVHR